MNLQGLILDNANNAPTSSWLRARNIIVVPKPTPHIKNERGFDKKDEIQSIVVGQIRTPNEEIFFSTNGVVGEIGIKRGNSDYEVIVRDALFEFSINHPIMGIFDYNYKKQLVLVWTDNNQDIFILNVDDLPFTKTVDNEIENKEDFELCKLFPSLDSCSIELEQVSSTNGSLKTGVYFVAISYGFLDESYLNYQPVSNKIVVIDDQPYQYHYKIDGIEGGTPTNKSIIINLKGIDQRYTYIKVGVISQINGIIDTKETKKVYIESDQQSITISNLDSLSPVSINKILQTIAVYNKAKTLTVNNKQLLLGNTEEPTRIDLQSYINDIKIEWYRKDLISLDSFGGSYKDPVIIFDKTSFKAGEVYAFYAKVNHKKGYTYGIYHIPGREANPGETSPIVDDLNILALDSVVKKYQIKDTSGYVSGAKTRGEMSYWENINEKYPVGFGGLDTQNVRHHKFPTLSALHHYHSNKMFLSADEVAPVAASVGTANLTFAGDYTMNIGTVGWTNGAYGTFSPNSQGRTNSKFAADRTQRIDLKISLHLTTTDLLGYPYQIEVIQRNEHGTILPDKGYTFFFEIHGVNETLNQVFNLEPLHTLELVYTPPVNPEALGLAMTSASIEFDSTEQDIILTGTKYAKPLGIIVSNIVLPDEIKDEIDSIEILYAERTLANMSIIGQSFLYPHCNWHESLDGLYNIADNSFVHIHPFDLLAYGENVPFTHIQNELLFNSDDKVTAIPAGVPDHQSINIVGNLTSANHFNVAEASQFRVISDISYLPANNTASIPNNHKKENSIAFKVKGAITLTPGTNRLLTNICVYKKDMYKGFMTQNLVSTGKLIKLDAAEFLIYGGDTVIVPYGFNRFGGSHQAVPIPDSEDFNYVPKAIRVTYIPVESSVNISLRHEDPLIDNTKYYPKTGFSHLVDTDRMKLTDPDATGDDSLFTNVYLMNNDYNALNSFVKGVVTVPNINIVDKFPFRIAKSITQLEESIALNWRTFLASDYYEIERNKGEIWNLVSQGRILYIMTERTMLVSIVKEVISALNEDIYLRTGQLFDRPPEEKMPTESGYIGSRSMFGYVLTEHGLITVDRLSGKIFWFQTVDNIVEISDSNAKLYFEEVLNIDKQDLVGVNPILVNPQAYLAAIEGTGLIYTSGYEYEKALAQLDNPILNKGVVLGYDQSNTRILLIVKNVERYSLDSGVVEDYLDGALLKLGVPTPIQPSSSFSFSLWGVDNSEQLVEVTLVCVDEFSGTPGVYEFLSADTPKNQAENIYDCLMDIVNSTYYNLTLQDEVIIIKSKLANDNYNLVLGANTTSIFAIEVRNSTKVIDKSETISFTFNGNFWVCKHDYNPTFIKHTNRNNGALASIDVNTDLVKSTLFYHNIKNKFGRYYDQSVTKPSFLDYVFTSKKERDFIIDSIKIETIIEDNGVSIWDKTLTHLAVYTEQRCTNLYTLVKQIYENTLDEGNIAYHRGEWWFNNFSDSLMIQNIKFIDKHDNLILKFLADNEVTEIVAGLSYLVTNINTVSDKVVYDGVEYSINNTVFIGKQGFPTFTPSGNAVVKNFKYWFEKSNFITKLAVVRLFYDNVDQHNMSLIDIKLNAKTLV